MNRFRRRKRNLLRELEQIITSGICKECGSWRCPECQWLIINWHDHKPGCPRERAQRLAEEGYLRGGGMPFPYWKGNWLMSGSIAEYDQLKQELRELTREAHGAVKDLTRVLREIRKVISDGAKEAEQRSYDAADKEMRKFAQHMQDQMNRQSADLNRSVKRAQDHIAKQLTLARMELDPETSQARFYFDGAPFDENAEVTERN